MKQFADDNFKFDENSIKFSKRVENTVGKAEIARYEQFLLFPQCFQKTYFPGASKGVIVWEWVNTYGSSSVQREFNESAKISIWINLHSQSRLLVKFPYAQEGV